MLSVLIRGLSLVFVLIGSVSAAFAVDVPNVLGLEPAEAIDRLERANLKAEQNAGGLISLQPIGAVALQRPAAGENVPANTVVRLTLSSGVWIRDFHGATHAAAHEEMVKTGVQFDFQPTQAANVPAGIVADQNPSGDQWVDASTTTVLFGVSVGEWIPVPALLGKSYTSASKELASLQLVATAEPGNSTENGTLPLGGAGEGDTTCTVTPYISEVIGFTPAENTLLFPQAEVRMSTKRKVLRDQAETNIPCFCIGPGGTNCVQMFIAVQ